MASELTYKVAMTCGGCSKAITALVGKLDGVDKVEANHEDKTVKVTGTNLDRAAIEAAIGKIGKEILEKPPAADADAKAAE